MCSQGYRTGYIYHEPVLKQDRRRMDRANSEVEIPPTATSFSDTWDGEGSYVFARSFSDSCSILYFNLFANCCRSCGAHVHLACANCSLYCSSSLPRPCPWNKDVPRESELLTALTHRHTAQLLQLTVQASPRPPQESFQV